MTETKSLASLVHQVAEQLTVALAEISLARKSAKSERELKDAIERAEMALLKAREPLQRLAIELAIMPEDE